MIWLQFKTFSHLHRCYHCFAIPVSQTETSQLLSVTHSDVPGAFAVGFVQAGKTFTGHDAGVYDQVASTVEDWPEREREKEILPFTSCAVGFRKCCFCLCSYTEEHWGKNLHTHTFRCEKHSLSLFSKAGKVPSKLSWYVFFFHRSWPNQARTVNTQYMCYRHTLTAPQENCTRSLCKHRRSSPITHGLVAHTPTLSHSDKHTSKQRQLQLLILPCGPGPDSLI